ncbi:MAG: hypothetical protein FJ096_05640 [Deltaproteobacteria bacterium]|nr:hypothetical protein [Deltaproteobacteria bacterium]
MPRKNWTRSFAAVAVLLTTAWGGRAAAQDAADLKSKPRAPRGVITLAEVTITGRLQKPIAAVDVQRIRASLTLTELKQPFLQRIEGAIYKEPF